MKRDMDLVRELMLRLEGIEMPLGVTRSISVYAEPLKIGSHDPSIVFGHLELLCGAGFIEDRMNASNAEILFTGLSWSGHDFLDSVRDPEIWQKTKDGAKAAGGFTVELLSDIAKGLIKTQIKKHTGVDV
jgi:Hypothetical protein (DUF2513)